MALKDTPVEIPPAAPQKRAFAGYAPSTLVNYHPMHNQSRPKRFSEKTAAEPGCIHIISYHIRPGSVSLDQDWKKRPYFNGEYVYLP
jgi:hypothetical protein